jgi:hypothetical protein
MTQKIIDDLSFKLLISNINTITKGLIETTVALQTYTKSTKELVASHTELLKRMNELDGRLFAIEHSKECV